jgi:hypothetical protein
MQEQEIHWVEAEGGYHLALSDGKLICKNKKGKVLTSVPKKVRTSEVGEQLQSLRDWMDDHHQRCADEVDKWLLRTLPIPTPLIQKVWADPAWRRLLENAIVRPFGGDVTEEQTGFLKAADPEKGLGVVNLDGETEWLQPETVSLPHPILLEDLDEWRELAADLGLEQGIAQLFRETFAKTKDLDEEATGIDKFSDGKFEQLRHVLGKCRSLGYKVSGGFAVCPVWEAGTVVEACFWVGAEDPEYETVTGELVWVDRQQHRLAIGKVTAVAFSEGMRMASAIYAARKVETEGEDDDS